MKVANKKPEIAKSRTYVNQDKYEVWYSKPVSLGTIDRRNGYWYSADGHRFLSSRDATDYLVKLRDMQFPIRDEVLVVTPVKPSLVIPQRRVVTTKKRASASADGSAIGNSTVSTHPKFQDYLKFLDFLQTSERPLKTS